MFSGTGQINMNSEFGYEVYNICKKESIKNIVEVGTWNGQGSTVCIMNALMEKNNKSILYSFEADKENYNKAVQFWNNKDTNNRLSLINAVLHRECLEIDEVKNMYPNVNDFVLNFYLRERELLHINNMFDISSLENIDVILLDGAEYTTYGDFNVLIKKNPKVIMLDDSNIFKCKQIRTELLNNPEWKLLKENLNDRHGWSIFVNVIYENEFN
jgi:hypothetical protein